MKLALRTSEDFHACGRSGKGKGVTGKETPASIVNNGRKAKICNAFVELAGFY